MRLSYFASLVVVSSGIAFAQRSPSTDLPTEIPVKPISFDLSAIDKTVDPCVDFYKFACGNWEKKNRFPTRRCAGATSTCWRSAISTCCTGPAGGADAPKSPLERKYGDYFAACMNAPLADGLGAKPIAANLAAIAALTDKARLAAFDVQMEERFGRPMLFNLSVTQDQKDATKQILSTERGC